MGSSSWSDAFYQPLQRRLRPAIHISLGGTTYCGLTSPRPGGDWADSLSAVAPEEAHRATCTGCLKALDEQTVHVPPLTPEPEPSPPTTVWDRLLSDE